MIENDDGAGLEVLTPDQVKARMALVKRLEELDENDPQLQHKIDEINAERLALCYK
jgi:hypothetical protein